MGALHKAMQYLGLVDDEDAYDDEDDDGRYHEPEVERRSERYSQPEPRREVREVREVRVAREPRDEPEVRRYDAAPAGGVATAPRLHKQTDSSRVRPVPVAPSEQRRRPVSEVPVPYRITTLQPSSYNEARQIGEEFRDGTPVIMNLTEMDDGDAKRLVDFAAGLIFGLRGSIEKVTSKVFLLSPGNVEVSAEDKRRIAEGGFYNQS